MSLQPCGSSLLYVVLQLHCISPVSIMHKSYPHWTLLWEFLSFYPTHMMRSPNVGTLFKHLDHHSLTGHIIRDCPGCLALGLSALLSLSPFGCYSSLLRNTCPSLPSFTQPSLRAFHWCSFAMLFLWSWPNCSLFRWKTCLDNLHWSTHFLLAYHGVNWHIPYVCHIMSSLGLPQLCIAVWLVTN